MGKRSKSNLVDWSQLASMTHMRVTDVAKALGVHHTSVMYQAKRLGLTFRGSGRARSPRLFPHRKRVAYTPQPARIQTGFDRPGRPPADPPGSHGTVSEYSRGCRCYPCARAHSLHLKARRICQAMGECDSVVSADRARRYLQQLSWKQVGYRAVADCTGIMPRVIQAIRSGRLSKIRKSTEAKIMAVQGSMRSGGALVPAAQSSKRLLKLKAMGITYSQVSEMLGCGSRKGAPTWFRGRFMTMASRLKFNAIYNSFIRSAQRENTTSNRTNKAQTNRRSGVQPIVPVPARQTQELSGALQG